MSAPVPVLFLVPALPIGGAEKQIAALIGGLDARRFRPLVACQHGLGPIAAELAAAGVPVRLLSGARRFDLAFPWRVASLVRRERVRLIVSHGFSTGVVARLAGPLAGAPVRVLAEHGTDERDWSPGKGRLNRWLSPLGTVHIAVAEGQRPYLLREKRIPAAKIRVIHNGIDPAPYRIAGTRESVRDEFGIDREAPVAGILAVLRPEKDHGTFLLAARLVLDSLPAARFLIVGDGPERGNLEREIAALGMQDAVVLAGHRDDVSRILSAFDAAVLCSTDVETFPLAFLEAMASGLPLIGTRVGGLAEMIDEGSNGLLVRPRDVEGLAGALRRLLGDPALAREWGRASRLRVEREFSAERMVAAYESLFTELLTRAGLAVPPAEPPATSA
jgi:glycosyltransferase involved in cell wall biosynthesis